MSSTKKLIILSTALCLFAWARVIWVLAMYIPPAQQMEYSMSKEVNLLGYAHAEPPYFIDHDKVWHFTSYSNDHKKKGFVRFDFAQAKAEMKWQLPEEKDYISIIGAVKNTDNRLAIMYEVGEKAKIAILSPEGKVESIEFILPSITIRGWNWVNNALEVATSINNIPVSSVYRYDSEGWKKHVVRWPTTDLSHKYATVLFAFYTEKNWKFVVTMCSETEFQSGKPINYNMYYLDSYNNMDLFQSIEEDTSFMYSKVEASPGNLISRTYGEKYHLQNNKLVLLSSGVEGIDKICQPTTFILKPLAMERVIDWGKDYYQPEFVRYPFGDYKFSYKPSSLIRGNQNSLFIEKPNIASPSPLTGEYRFGVNHTIVPLAENRFGVLGAFGYYVIMDNTFKRILTASLWQRVTWASKQFYSRNIYYDDFLFDYRHFKSFSLPIILFLFPLLILLARIGNKERLYQFAGGIYVLSFCIFFFWFWRISFFL